MSSEDPLDDRLQLDQPHSARVWNFLLGGKDNYAADRQAGEMILKMFPDIALLARLQRHFLVRAVSRLAREAGIRQFLDSGTGLPTVDNTLEVAQQVPFHAAAGGPITVLRFPVPDLHRLPGAALQRPPPRQARGRRPLPRGHGPAEPGRAVGHGLGGLPGAGPGRVLSTWDQ